MDKTKGRLHIALIVLMILIFSPILVAVYGPSEAFRDWLGALPGAFRFGLAFFPLCIVGFVILPTLNGLNRAQ